MIVFKKIILCQNVSEKTNVSKRIVMQALHNPLRIFDLKSKG